MKKELAILVKDDLILLPNGKIEKKQKEIEVEIMAIVKNYSMVRRKGCMPFVVDTRKLKRG